MTKSPPESIFQRIEKNGASDLVQVLMRWKPWLPPRQDQGFQQGGTFVFSGDAVKYDHYDASTGAHAPPEDFITTALAAKQSMHTAKQTPAS